MTDGYDDGEYESLPEKPRKGPQLASGPKDPFRCDKFSATLDGRICVERQCKQTTHYRSKKPAPDVAYLPCSAGRCRQGRDQLKQEWAANLVVEIRARGKKIEPT